MSTIESVTHMNGPQSGLPSQLVPRQGSDVATNIIPVPSDAPILCAFGLFYAVESESAFDSINVYLLDAKKLQEPPEPTNFPLEEVMNANNGESTTDVIHAGTMKAIKVDEGHLPVDSIATSPLDCRLNDSLAPHQGVVRDSGYTHKIIPEGPKNTP